MTKLELIQQLAEDFAELKRTMFGHLADSIQHVLPRSQGELLFLVSKNGALNIKQVAGEMRISSGAVTQLVDGLVERGLIERRQDEQDRRIVHIMLSQKGGRQLSRLHTEYLRSFEKTMNVLSETELTALAGLLKKLTANKGI